MIFDGNADGWMEVPTFNVILRYSIVFAMILVFFELTIPFASHREPLTTNNCEPLPTYQLDYLVDRSQTNAVIRVQMQDVWCQDNSVEANRII